MSIFKRLREALSGGSEATLLLVGLGNPGREFHNNRHNVGFMVLDRLAEQLGAAFTRVQNEALVTKAIHNDQRLLLAKPRTYMNNSGRSVGALARFYKLQPEQVVVVFDDVDLPFETLRIRASGSSGGHQGMNSIIEHLGTQEFARLRVGIGRPKGRMETPDYVLQAFSKGEQEVLPLLLDRAAEALLAIVEDGIEQAMTRYNRSEM